MGIPKTRVYPRMKERAIKAYREGASSGDLSRRFGVASSTILNWVAGRSNSGSTKTKERAARKDPV